MSWQLVSLVVVLFSLGAGMLWYERSRPPSQIVALVAVLAALAVAGRIVLAPIPNVVATTDIVIIAGFVLGPAPGFAVGALGGLVSNFWLGQGVWTPWQMVAWGMSGVAGGMLWKITGGRINRWWLAAFCAAAGLVFGAWMNLQTMVSFGGEISLDRYLALEVRAIPFDIAHMVGNAVFALVAGPAMIAALVRFRDRFEWRQSEGGLAGVRSGAGVTMIVLGALLFATVGQTPDRAEAAYTTQAKKAATWLRAQQNSDGGFAAIPGGTSSLTITTRSMFALASVGINPLDVRKDASPYGYLVSQRKQIRDPNEIALTILALKTVGQDPKKFEGRNLIKALRAKRKKNGAFKSNAIANDVNVTAFSVLAFRSAGASKDAQFSLKWLYEVQKDNGGWGIDPDANSDADTTGAVMMAITGKERARRAFGFLRKIQKDSGGFGNSGNTNAQSTGLVMQGQVAQGRSVNYLKSGKGKSASDYLLSLQQADGSVFLARDLDTTKVWVTADATTAMAGKALPISAPPREEKEKPEDNNTDTGNGGTTTYPNNSTYSPGTMANPGNYSSGNGNKKKKSNPVPVQQQPDLGEYDATETNPGDLTVPLIPEAPSDAVLAASERGPQPSTPLAILIGLAVSGGLCGGTILLARRFRW